MAFFIFPMHFLTVTVFIIYITLSLSTSHGADEKYENCSNLVSCGKVTNIGYPFWGLGRAPYCGHQNLSLDCPINDSNNHPVLRIGDISYNVLDIPKDSQSITLLPQYPHSTCQTINPLKLFEYFEYSSTVMDIYLFYGDCPCHRQLDHVNFTANGGNVTAYYLQNMSDDPNIVDYLGNERCKSIVIPVLKGELERLENKSESLLNVLEKGFEVDFKEEYPGDHFLYEHSGGLCGRSSKNSFMCLCEDRTYPDQCYKSKKSGTSAPGAAPRPAAVRNPLPTGTLKLILGLAIPGCLCILMALNVGLCCWMKKFKFRTPTFLSRSISFNHTQRDLESGSSFLGVPIFTYGELREATHDFDSAGELGDGGFGIVYHGKLRDGREVAVKRLYEKNYKRVGQFMNEVEILTRLRHQNLVTLYGCTSRHSRELLLVYEYVPNGTVADHLYGEQSNSGSLTWSIRMKIVIETASALLYLHACDIIHRDVKTNNILLDKNFSVKVADFGLSRLFPCDATHVSTAPQGTPGYLDPEYHKFYQVTDKSDVYSFGVVLIELISSLPAIDINRHADEINLSDYALNRIQNGELDTLVDQKLGLDSNFRAKRMAILVAELAFQCLQQEGEVRPSMAEVLEALKHIESRDYEVLESEEKSRSKGSLNSTVMGEENVVDHQRLENKHPPSPISVIESWVSKSSVSDPSI